MAQQKAQEAGQYLSFVLAGELYALDISKVREVLEVQEVTKIPRTPEFLRGVINLRGNAVPVVDMRLKFGMSATEYTVNTCIIIMEVNMDGEELILGALADSVREVIELTGDEIKPPPRMGTTVDTNFISGMSKQDEQFIMLLDIDTVFSAEELQAVRSVDVAPEPVQKCTGSGTTGKDEDLPGLEGLAPA
ncbi:chemotaxis protein CheW [Desulfobaculum bizertense]|uniref:chemotaxis protein CheW n=1 Tax=Desulfobaculum bizertense TaxID=376490 RepID=UPI001F2EA4E0|nr:chemotaxis protein CheW [Desulfobaculum bizertense]UIJ37991.1 chemotaxis protein CheW [Desulfobaculum bizertense]